MPRKKAQDGGARAKPTRRAEQRRGKTTVARAARKPSGSPRSPPRPRGGRRDANRTRERLLEAARIEFWKHGYEGARIERIAKRARANIRMIYHYFGSKEKLYLGVMESIYIRVREPEAALDLRHLEPLEAIARLVEFTFDHLVANPDFVSLVMNENLMRGRFVRKSSRVPQLAQPLVESVADVLERGRRSGVFEVDVDPVQLYVTILALCFVHLSNRHTLSSMFQRDLGDSAWLAERRDHVRDVVLSYLTQGRAA